MAGSLLNTDRITKNHSIKRIECATKEFEGREHIRVRWTVVGR